MSLTSGFFDSVNHDRKYNTLQMSSIFDGIIRDGVFMSIADKLMVDAESGMTIVAKPGRAWFNHTWTLNDAKLPLVVEQSELILDRIDAVVLEVNRSQAVRVNTIKMVKGTPSADPQKPTLIKSLDVNQYPLAYVSVKHGVTVINQADITNAVGTSECPFVTGILETISIDELVSQWKSEWELWINEMKENGEDWQNQVESEFEAWSTQQKEEFTQFIQQFEATMQIFQTNSEEAFNKWFETVKDILDDNTAGNLLNLINEIKDGNPNATATYNGKVVSIVSNPTTAKNIYFYAPSNFVETDTYTLNGLPLTITDLNGEPINNAWKAGSPVSLIIKGNIGFFKSGGGGRNDTLPPMVTELKAVAGNQTIELMWKNPISEALAGILVTYNQNRIPEHPFDGTKIDVEKKEKTTIGFLNNGTKYFIRIFPYNSKKQYQTVLDGATISATPSEGPLQVTNLEITGSGSSPILSWKNPTDDPTYHETVVIQKEDSAPTSLSDGTEIYRGNGETVSPEGLERLHNYYWGVFTVNAEGGTRGPIVTEVYSYDFPDEPSSYSEITQLDESLNWMAPEDGWFQIDAVSKSGDGGNGSNGDFLPRDSGGSGGSGAISRKSKIKLNKNETVDIVIDSEGNVIIEKIGVTVTCGKRGSDGSSGHVGIGGSPGNASGGDININGNRGNDGKQESASIVSVPNTNAVSTSNEYGYPVVSGYGGGSKRGTSVIYGGAGSKAFVKIFRGDTNIPSPSSVSTLSLIPHSNEIEATWKNSGDPEQAGTILVANENHMPENISDGTVYDVSDKEAYTVSELQNGKPCYVALFAYNTDKTKFSSVKADVEIPRDRTWYDEQSALQSELTSYKEYYNTTQGGLLDDQS